MQTLVFLGLFQMHRNTQNGAQWAHGEFKDRQPTAYRCVMRPANTPLKTARFTTLMLTSSFAKEVDSLAHIPTFQVQCPDRRYPM